MCIYTYIYTYAYIYIYIYLSTRTHILIHSSEYNGQPVSKRKRTNVVIGEGGENGERGIPWPQGCAADTQDDSERIGWRPKLSTHDQAHSHRECVRSHTSFD